MIIYCEFDTFINGHNDLVELNIIRLIDTTLKLLKKEVIFSDVERRFYIYDEKSWQPIELAKVISIFWMKFSKEIFPQLNSHKIKKSIEYNKFVKSEDESGKKESKRILDRYNFFVKLTQRKIKEYIESLAMACDRIPDLNFQTIPLNNGYIDINDFSFNPIDPYIYNRYALPFNFTNENKEPRVFLSFLKQIMPDEEDRDFLIKWLAYMLINGNHRQKSLFFFGSGRNGKGVLSKIIYQLLGVDNCSTLTVAQLSGEKYFLGQLNNKLLNISPDSDERDKIDIGAFKTLTGNDNVTVRDIYGSPFNMIYTGKLLFSINKVPFFSNKDFAVMERVEILNFPVTIKEEDRIPNLESIILEKEGDLIFNFLLKKLKELKEIEFKFKAPASVKDFTNNIIDEQDNISTFLIDYINEEDDYKWKIGLSFFHLKYKEYMLEASFKVLNRTNFKESVIRWSERRKDITVKYMNDGKNYVFEFIKTTSGKPEIVYETIDEKGNLIDENGEELF